MKKNQTTLKEREKYIKEQINGRHKSLNTSDVVRELAKKLFLSEETIWKDFAKQKNK
jgi:hypothetical protein